jgi:hypothetical protein
MTTPVYPITGVAYVPPPPELIPSIRASLDKAVAALSPGAKGGFFGIATYTPDGTVKVNAALVTVLPQHWTVDLWVGKSWGTALATQQRGFEGGVQAMKTW